MFIACSDESESAIRASPLVMTMKGSPNISIAQGNAFYDDIVKPFWVNSVPVAFLIDKLGVVCWHGHPVDKTLQVLSFSLYILWAQGCQKCTVSFHTLREGPHRTLKTQVYKTFRSWYM